MALSLNVPESKKLEILQYSSAFFPSGTFKSNAILGAKKGNLFFYSSQQAYRSRSRFSMKYPSQLYKDLLKKQIKGTLNHQLVC